MVTKRMPPLATANMMEMLTPRAQQVKRIGGSGGGCSSGSVVDCAANSLHYLASCKPNGSHNSIRNRKEPESSSVVAVVAASTVGESGGAAGRHRCLGNVRGVLLSGKGHRRYHHGSAKNSYGGRSLLLPLAPRRLLSSFRAVTTGFLLLVVAVLTAPGVSVFRRLLGPDGTVGGGIGGVWAAPCSGTVGGAAQQVVVTNETQDGVDVDLTAVFDCEDGEFEVSWSGAVSVGGTINIGRGTTVTIVGDATNSTTNSTGNSSSSGSEPTILDASSTSDLRLELALSGLSVPTESLSSAAVGLRQQTLVSGNLTTDDDSIVSFGPLFFVDGGQLVLQDMAIRDGFTTNSTVSQTLSGGGVHAIDANVTITGCEFENNFGVFWGGAIHANRSTLVVMDTVFRDNQAGVLAVPDADDDSVNGAGGGIGAENTNILIDGCLFEDNYASKKGAGIHQGVGQVSVVNSVFYDNEAGSENVDELEHFGEGAAISFTVCTLSFDGLGFCGATDSAFIGNRVGRKGGAVVIGSGGDDKKPSYVEFNRCLVDNSTTGKAHKDDPQGEGGAFAVADGTVLVLKDSLVIDNYAGKKGGALTLSSGGEENPGATVLLDNSSFIGNWAEQDGAGVINVGEYSVVNITGECNFTANECGGDGAVLGASTNTRVTVEDGSFVGNSADEAGGVFWTKGELNILGGNFSGNSASSSGGAIHAAEEASVTVSSGTFSRHEGHDGGVAFVSEEAALLVQGGVFTGNLANNGGGVFYAEDGGAIEITGGNFSDNEADFGGFIYKEGEGMASCTGASVLRHRGVDGGAIYAVDEATLEWECDLRENEALAGPAIYARAGAAVVLRGVTVSDNVVARGSVVFIVDSDLMTYGVVFNDSSGSSDLSAVQADQGSAYMAEDTSFEGFEGEAIVFSEGELYLDDCDFSGSSASILVFSENQSSTVVRNAVLGDNNYKDLQQTASDTNMFPTANNLMNANASCTSGRSLCSEGSTCLDGDVGVYCQCYVRMSTGDEKCLDGNTDLLTLAIKSAPDDTFYPSLLEGDLLLALDTTTAAAASSDESNSTVAGGVVWNVSAVVSESMDWTVFPSAGLLRPGESIVIRVASRPDDAFDDTATATFLVDSMGEPEDDQVAVQVVQAEEEGDEAALSESMDVTFYHCNTGTFWNVSSCELCTDAIGDIEGLDCLQPGASIRNLPIRSGFWRASLSSVTVRECFNEDACIGGSDVATVEDYCDSGYEGPRCAVCSTDYGRGVANECHLCTDGFKGGMYFLLAVATLITLLVAALLAVYLVGGRGAVSSTMNTTRESVRTLQRRGSGLFLPSSNIGTSSSKGSRSGGGKSVHGPLWTKRAKVARDSSNSSINAGSNSDSTGSCVARAYSGVDDDVEGGEISSNVLPPPSPPPPTNVPALAGDVAPGDSLHGSGRVVVARKDSTGQAAVTPVDRRPRGEEAKDGEDGDSGDDELPGSVGVSEPPGPRRRSVAPGGTSIGGSGREDRRAQRGETKKKTAATRIGDFFSRLPLSKLKIVIVVWQISSAFAGITQVPFPPAFEKFLSLIGIFTFDLGWIFSAACLTVGVDFYDKLLLVTIGPLVILCILGVTFYIGSRPKTSDTPRRHASSRLSTSRSFRTSDVSMSSRTLSLDGRSSGGRDEESPPSALVSTHGTARGAEGTEERSPPASPGPRKRELGSPQRSVRGVWKAGPGDDINSDQNQLWWLFARHTTILLIILYLVYSQVSTVVFQTFACDSLPEIGKSYLRADFRIECDTAKHDSFKIYAAFMIILYPLGIPAAFCYFLVRQRSRINPPTDKILKDQRGASHVVNEKIAKRRGDLTVAPTSFLWNAYYPNRYYYEVCECVRRLLLTGLLVFLVPDTSGQVAFSCVFAFLSLLAFELLRPHVDYLDTQLYRTGCLVIFFTNFLALLIKAGVADANSRGSAVYSVALIVVNILFFLSIWWNTWAVVKAAFSRRHVQDVMLGVDFVGEKKMDKLLGPTKSDRVNNAAGKQGEIKTEDSEAAPAWEREASVGDDGNGGNIDSTGRHAREVDAHSIPSSIKTRSKFFGFSSAVTGNAEDGDVSVSGRHGTGTAAFPAAGGVGGGGGATPTAVSRALKGDVLSNTATPRARHQGGAAGLVGSVGTVVSSVGGGRGPSCASPAEVPAFGGGDRDAFVRATSFSKASAGAQSREGPSSLERGKPHAGYGEPTDAIVAPSPNSRSAVPALASSQDISTEGGRSRALGVSADGGEGSALVVEGDAALVSPGIPEM